jgi:hypothetical protein
MPGSFRVTESGAAEYRIPIRVPPGIAGMEPKLALVYNSRAGNGLLGVGWSLEGLSSITRCPRTMAQDEVRGGVNYDWNDRYCLDWQRLVRADGTLSDSWAGGIEFRTERDGFLRIRANGLAGAAPAWFQVKTKSGQTLDLEYGSSEDARIEAQGRPEPRVWALNKITDSSGNALTVTYHKDGSNGDYRPLQIDYPYGGLGAANASVRFSYAHRPDVLLSYAAGSMVRVITRIDKVQTCWVA